MKTIGEKLKELREKASFNQQQIADYLDIDQSYVCKIESNVRKVSIENLEKLALLYGIKLSDFDNDDIDIKPIKFSMRCSEINSDDLKQIAEINSIASESKEMANAIKEKKW